MVFNDNLLKLFAKPAECNARRNSNHSGCSGFDYVQNLPYVPVPVAARSKTRNVFDRSNTRIAGSNPARGIDVCPYFSVLCCPV
jgi:hypothetical protein